MTEKELILETCGAYNSTNRAATAKGGCFYLMNDGKGKCAVGRCMTAKALRKFKAGSVCEGYSATRISQVFGGLDQFLLKRYKGFKTEFWANLQRLHDNEIFWNETGLSLNGEKYRDELLKKYSKESKA